MKKLLYFILFILPVMGIIMGLSSQRTNTPKSLGWILAYQSFTFKNFTFEEGLQKANQLGLKYVEVYPGQKISSASDMQTHYSSDEAAKKEMKALLKKYRVKLVNYGVVNARNEEEWKKIFDFAKEMKIDAMGMNNYGSSLIFGHPQGPTATRLIIEGIEETVMAGGGYMLWTGCAAGDCGAAVILKIS